MALVGAYASLMIIFWVLSLAIVMFFDAMAKQAGGHLPYTLGFRPIFYMPYILWEIVKANIDIIKVIINPSMPMNPKVIRVKASQQTDIAKVIYANSITLTPGTIALDVRGDEIMVHALTNESAAGVESGIWTGGSPSGRRRLMFEVATIGLVVTMVWRIRAAKIYGLRPHPGGEHVRDHDRTPDCCERFLLRTTRLGCGADHRHRGGLCARELLGDHRSL